MKRPWMVLVAVLVVPTAGCIVEGNGRKVSAGGSIRIADLGAPPATPPASASAVR